jgi:hypothetical protein
MLICVLADIHAGSTVALCPPKFINHEGNEIKLNPIQLWLWRRWSATKEFIEAVAQGREYVLVLNGDMIEGNHHRTTQIISPEVGDHVEAAYQILEPIAAKASKVFMVRGTECHTADRENTLGKRLGAETNPDSPTRCSFDKLLLDANGIRIAFTHHIVTSSRTWTEANGLSAALNQEQLEASKNGEKLTQILCCAHRHRFGFIGDTSGMCVVSPPWQLLTRHGHKVVPLARTCPGVFLLDFEGKGHGEMPVLRHRTFKAKHQTAIRV